MRLQGSVPLTILVTQVSQRCMVLPTYKPNLSGDTEAEDLTEVRFALDVGFGVPLFCSSVSTPA